MNSVAPADGGGSPVMPVSARFPTGRDRFAQLASGAVGARPFGLRFAADVPAPVAAPRVPVWRLDPVTQVAVTAAEGAPLHRMAGSGTKASTGQTPDGGPSTGGEEWSPDFHGDAEQ